MNDNEYESLELAATIAENDRLCNDIRTLKETIKHQDSVLDMMLDIPSKLVTYKSLCFVEDAGYIGMGKSVLGEWVKIADVMRLLNETFDVVGSPAKKKNSKPRNFLDAVKHERIRQIAEKGYVPEDDDNYTRGELISAAISYCQVSLPSVPPTSWPWSAHFFKPSVNNMRNLIKAMALILAELERIDREGRRNDSQ